MLLEVIIPAYRPDNRIFELVRKLRRQKVRPDRITIILTCSEDCGPDYFDKLCGNDLKIKTVLVSEFGHGRTRQAAAYASEASYVLFMTQDAVPADDMLTANLLSVLDDPNAAVAYARQIAYPNADPVEKYTRGYNYPPISRSQSAKDLQNLGIRAIFCSDTCAMYDMEIFKKLGGFDTDAEFNEDEIYAYKAITSEYTVEYTASACVLHSHELVLKEQYKRYFDIAVSQMNHPEIFEKVSSVSEGIRYAVKGTLHFLVRFRLITAARFAILSLIRYTAFKSGRKHYKKTGGRHEN